MSFFHIFHAAYKSGCTKCDAELRRREASQRRFNEMIAAGRDRRKHVEIKSRSVVAYDPWPTPMQVPLIYQDNERPVGRPIADGSGGSSGRVADQILFDLAAAQVAGDVQQEVIDSDEDNNVDIGANDFASEFSGSGDTSSPPLDTSLPDSSGNSGGGGADF